MISTIRFTILISLIWACSSGAAEAESQRKVIPLVGGWRFHKGPVEGAQEPAFSDASWRIVDVPHDWSIEDLEPLPAQKPLLDITEGKWRFSKGDNEAWKAPDCNDSQWAVVELPAAWEEHSGYTEDNVYGWFRRNIDIPEELAGKPFDLSVGWVHSVDETYLNGRLIGATGSFPPNFRGASTEDRCYPVEPVRLKGDGGDIVAVRVYKAGGYGGGMYRKQMPHTRSGPFDTKAPGMQHTGYTLGGIGWYRQRFTVPTERKGDPVRLQFGGVYQDADVWINGRHLGNHPYGYTSFGYDLTPHLKYGEENILAVQVKNLGDNSRWFSGSGIYRPVWLTITEPVHIAHWGTFITTPQVTDREAVVHLQTRIENGSESTANITLRTQLFDSKTGLVASHESPLRVEKNTFLISDRSLKITSPKKWSPESPHLYTAAQEILLNGRVIDSTTERFGVRTLSFSVQDGFQLNGEPMLLKGSCMHHDNGPLGAAAFSDAEYRRVRLTKAAGFNAVRCAHNPPSTAFLDACDELGILVIDEAFDTWNHGKGGSSFYARHFQDCWQADLDAMILRDRNHPSIIMWSIGNEIPQNDTETVSETAGMLADYVRRLDPTRPVTSGVQGVNPKKDGFFAALDVSGYNYAFKWNEGHVYEKNAYVNDHARHPDRIMYGAESFPSQSFEYWMAAVDHSWVLGDFAWTGWDYLGESSIGWIGFGHPVYWPVAYCGDISITGVRRPASYYRGTLFGNDAVSAFVHCPQPSFEHTRRYDWGFDDVQASWTWPGYEGTPLNVVVFSSCDEVEMLLNGKPLDKRPVSRQSRYRATFSVPYAPGTLKVIGYKEGKTVSDWTLKTAAAPEAIRLLPERTVIKADGQSLAYIPFEIVDTEGSLHPHADPLVRVEIEGPGVLAAIANDNPASLESFQQPCRKAYRGRGLVIIKSTEEAGTIRLTARSEGLSPASIKIQTQ